MSDRRYSSVAWKRLRAQILARDQYTCQVSGPRCTGFADTVDHIVPVSAGGPFWDARNLRGSCRRCNYGGGASARSAAVANQRLVEHQADEIEQLRDKVARLEAELARQSEPQPSRQPRIPSIR